MASKKSKKVETVAIVPVTGTEGLDKMAEYYGTAGTYEIFGVKTEDGIGPLVETEIWRLFVAKNPAGQIGLMKVNRPEIEDAYHMLERETRILRTLQTIAEQIDDETEGPQKPFHGANLPIVLETIEPEPGKLVVFLGYHPSITTYKQLVPLTVALNGQRMDMKSAAWLLGKSMKTLAFVHSIGFTIGLVDSSNVFIETAQHGVFILDFSGSNEDPTEIEQLAEVAEVAKVVWNAVGGTDSENPPHDSDIMTDEQYADFVAFLERLIGEAETADRAHKEAYKLFDSIWPRKPIPGTDRMKRDWHEFAIYPR